MRARSIAFGFLALGLVTVAGCHAVFGIEDRELDPPLVGVCRLPSSGDANLRFANLVTDAQSAVDLCLTKSGTSYGRGILRGGGTDCPKGFKYADVTRAFPLPAGTYDAKVIAYGSRCDAPALIEQKNISVPAGKTVTLTRMGPQDGRGAVLKAFVDSVVPAKIEASTTLYRFVNAIPGGAPLDVGLVADQRPPTKLIQRWFTAPVPPFESSAGLTAAIYSANPDGYMQIPNTSVNVGAARTGTPDATLALFAPGEGEALRTLYAIGDPTQPLLPVRGLLCNELATDKILATCTQSGLSSLAVDVISASLYGGRALVEDERREVLFDKIALRGSDVICVTQVGRRKEKELLLAKAASAFPYSVNVFTDLDTKATVAEDQSGAVPVAPTTPSCGGPADPAKTRALLDCLTANCTTTGTDAGPLKQDIDWTKPASDCFAQKCAVPFISLLDGATPEEKKGNARCYNCTLVNFLSDKTMAEVRATCTLDNREASAFDGETPSLLLSRYPIKSQETFNLPSTTYRRAVHYAEVEIEPGKTLDVYCGHISADLGELVPYPGPYSTGRGWPDERLLQVKRLAEFVKRKSGSRPAIIAGEWESSTKILAADGSGKVVIDEQNAEVMAELEKIFVHATPTGKDPPCTLCPENPISAPASSFLPTRVLTLGFPPEPAAEISSFFREPIVTITRAPGGMVPVSGVYGLEVLVKRPF